MGPASGMGGPCPEPARSSLAACEMFATMFPNGTRVEITEKITDGTSASFGRDEHGGARAYDVAAVPLRDPRGTGPTGRCTPRLHKPQDRQA